MGTCSHVDFHANRHIAQHEHETALSVQWTLVKRGSDWNEDAECEYSRSLPEQWLFMLE